MTIKQAAAILGLSDRKVYDLCQQRRITHYRFGNRITLDLADVEAFRDAARVEAASPSPRRAPGRTKAFVNRHYPD